MRVFLSYRRDDAAGHTGRLHDNLVERLGRENVFQDVEAIGPGERFAETIDRTIAGSDLVLAVIGRRWLAVDPDTGRPRLDDPDDVMRRELESALRVGRRVVPVIVDSARLPPRDALPEALQSLLDHNAVEIRDDAWSRDVDRLYDAIGVPRRTRPRWLLPVGALLAVAVLVAAAFGVRALTGDGGSAGDSTSSPSVELPDRTPEPQPAVAGVQTQRTSGTVEWTVLDWWDVPEPGSNRSSVVLRVKVANDTSEAISVYRELIHLRAAQIDYPSPNLTPLTPSENPGPGEAVLVKVEFTGVPAGDPLSLIFDFDNDRTELVLRP